MYVNARLPFAGGLIKQTTAAADWSVRLQRICRSIRPSVSICQLALSLLKVEYVGSVTNPRVWRYFLCVFAEGGLGVLEATVPGLVPASVWRLCAR